MIFYLFNKVTDTRIYRKTYRINHFTTGDTYSLVNVYSLTAECFRVSDSFLMENPIVYNESTGIYYVILDDNIYSGDEIYEIIWSIRYVSTAPIKELTTRFRFDTAGNSNVILVDGFDYEIKEFGDQYEGIQYEIEDFGNNYEGLEYEIFYN